MIEEKLLHCDTLSDRNIFHYVLLEIFSGWGLRVARFMPCDETHETNRLSLGFA